MANERIGGTEIIIINNTHFHRYVVVDDRFSHACVRVPA